MHAIRHDEFGPAEVLRYEPAPVPEPGPGQVRIAVRAAGVHLLDTAIRAGSGPGPRPELPCIPGREVAGTVEALGPQAPRRLAGARVVAHLGFQGSGGYAEFAVRDAEALHVLPDGLAFDTAVAMIGTGRTALGILEAAPLGAHDVVLVTAAAGGVGTLLVQHARAAGAAVVAAAGGPRKTALVGEAGADLAVDYDEPDWPERVRAALEGRQVTVAFDGVGGERGRACLELLGPAGHLVMYGWASAAGRPTQVTTGDLAERGLSATWAIGPAMLRRRGLRELEAMALDAAVKGRLAPRVQTFALADAAAAHAALESRATVGKVVLVP